MGKLFPRWSLFLASFFWLSVTMASNQNLIYQGRVVRPSGDPINSGNLVFTLAVYSPSPSHCLLYSETQNVNMVGSQGMFSLALGDGARTDTGSSSFHQIFVNGGIQTGLHCAIGTSYTPAATDERVLEVSFSDAGQTVALKPVKVTSVPFALQAHEIDGWSVNNLVKVSSVGSPTTFTTSEMANLKTVGAGNCTSGEILKWNGSAWMCSTDATGGAPGDAEYTGSKGIVAFDTDAATSGIAVASGIAKLSDTGVTAATYGSSSKVSSLTVNAQGRITAASEIAISIPSSQITQSGANIGEVLKWNGSAWLPAADNTGISPGDATYAAKGLVQGLTDAATSGLNISSGVISVNSGVGANQIVKLDSASKLPAVDGSALTNLRMTQIASGTLPISQGGTGAGTKSAAFDALSPNTTKGDMTVRDASGNVRLPVGSDGQVLTADSSQASGVKWAPVTAGTVTSITGGSGLLGGTITSTGTLSVNVGTGTNQIVQLDGSAKLPAIDGSQLTNLSAAQISSGILSVSRGGTGVSSLSGNRLVATNATGTALQSLTCSLNQLLSFDAAGNFVCSNLSNLANGTYFANGGSSFGGSATLGTSDANTLTLKTNNTARLTLDSAGNVGVGVSNPASALDVNGTLRLEGTTAGYVGLRAPASAGSVTFTLPSSDGAAGAVLTTNGAGGLSFAALSGGGGAASQNEMVVLTSGTSWTTPAGITAATKFKITLVGGGGGGGGASGKSGTCGGGGGAGAVAIYSATGLSPSTSYSYVIGGAGSAGANTGGSGGVGGATSITLGTTTVSAGGGSGGTGATASTQPSPGGAGGTATNGTLNIAGQSGGEAWSTTGMGASTVLGTGGMFHPCSGSVNTSYLGSNGTGYGSGGGGAAANGGSNSTQAGGSGASGIILIEYAL